MTHFKFVPQTVNTHYSCKTAFHPLPMYACRHLEMASGMQSLQKSKAFLFQNLKFQICREAGIKFFSGDIFGFFGYCFMDLIDHEYVEEITKVRHSLNYLPWLMVLITVIIF